MRFHQHANTMHALDARMGSAESTIRVIERDLDDAKDDMATSKDVQSMAAMLELKLDLIRGDLALVRKVVFGLIAIIMVAVVGALMRGTLK